MKLALVATAACLISAASDDATAQNHPGREFAITGAGAKACELYIAESEDARRIMLTWVQGFLSGINTHRYASKVGDMLLLPGADETKSYLAQYCKANPQKTMMSAAIALWKTVEPSPRPQTP